MNITNPCSPQAARVFCLEKSHHLRKKMMARCQVLELVATHTTCGYPARISTKVETHRQAAAR